MNGIHDMGGMHNMGPIPIEKNEPVFHAVWEAKTMAMWRALNATGRMRGHIRQAIESIPASEYMRMSYYERFITALIEQAVASNIVTRDEVATGRPAPGSPQAVPGLTVAQASSSPAGPARKLPAVVARFKAAQRVRARNMHPTTHTRLPRYARGRMGTIDRDLGVFVFPDTNVYGRGEKPQHLYTVRFSARELWGDQAVPQDVVFIDMWEDYLEPA